MARITLDEVKQMEVAAVAVQVVADLFGVDRRSATRAMDRGEIPCIKIGARRLVPRLPLIAMLEATSTGGAA